MAGLGEALRSNGPDGRIAGLLAEDTAELDWNARQDGSLAFLHGYAIPQGSAASALSAAELLDLALRSGPEALRSLRGCFVAGVFDARIGEWMIRRDRLGGRVAFHASDRDSFLLSSGPARIAQLIGDTEPDPAWLHAHFSLSSSRPEGRSPFAGVRELRPGELLRFGPHGLSTLRDTPELAPDFDYGDDRRCIERFGTLFEQAVRDCLPSEGNVACMLSGGLDSPPTAVVARQQLQHRQQSLLACSWSLPQDPAGDESIWIRSIADHAGLSLNLADATSIDAFGDLDGDWVSVDLPAYNAVRGLVNLSYATAAANGCKVVLNAANGDDIYPAWAWLYVDLYGRADWGALITTALNDLFRLGPRRFRRHPAPRRLARLLLGREQPGSTRSVRPWLQPTFALEHGSPPLVLPAFDELLDSERWLAQRIYGPGAAFGQAHEQVYAQRYGVCRRDPFQNEALLRFMVHAPHRLTYRDGKAKWIMRELMRGRLPEAVRRKGRTGLLDGYVEAGLRKHRARIERLLFSEERDWQHYVRPEVLRAILAGDLQAAPMVLISQCIGHALWLRKLREHPARA